MAGQQFTEIWNHFFESVYYSGEYQTYEQFIHRGIETRQCQVLSVLLMMPFVVWSCWHLHFVLVSKYQQVARARVEHLH